MDRRVPAGIAVLAVLIVAFATALVTLVASGAYADRGSEGKAVGAVAAASDPDYLFSQGFASGTLTGPSDSNLTLTLKGLRTYVTAFTDRPERQANLLSNADFFRMWDAWFDADPPNAVVSYTPDGLDRPVGVVVKLVNPRYFPETNVVTYQAVKIPKSDSLIPGAEIEVRKDANDPNVQNHIESFGPGMLFIDDATTLQTSFTGFFNAATMPKVNDTLSHVALTSSVALDTVTVTGDTDGTLTGTLTAALGASGATPLQMNGTFSWSGPNDWSVTLASAAVTGQRTTVTGTIADSGGQISSTLTVNTKLGARITQTVLGQTVVVAQPVPVTLNLSYDGVGTFVGQGSAGDFMIQNSLFSNVTVSFTTASPSITLSGMVSTGPVIGSTVDAQRTVAFSGTYTGGTFSVDVEAVLPTNATVDIALTGTASGGLSGSLALTDVVIGGTSFPTLTLVFDTLDYRISASGTMVTDLGIVSGGFKSLNRKLTDISFSGSDFVFGPGLTLDTFSFNAATGTAADSSCTDAGKLSFSGNSNGSITIKGKTHGTFSNALSFQCGKFGSEEFQVTVSHQTGAYTRALSGIIYLSEDPGTILPCPATTNPLDGGCGTDVPYIASPIASGGPYFYGSLTYGASVSKHFSYSTIGSTDANVEGTIGIGIAVYSTSTGDWEESIGLGGQLGANMSITYVSTKYSGGGQGAAICAFNTTADDFTCSIAFDSRLAGTVLDKTYAYHYSFTDTGSF